MEAEKQHPKYVFQLVGLPQSLGCRVSRHQVEWLHPTWFSHGCKGLPVWGAIQGYWNSIIFLCARAVAMVSEQYPELTELLEGGQVGDRFTCAWP